MKWWGRCTAASMQCQHKAEEGVLGGSLLSSGTLITSPSRVCSIILSGPQKLLYVGKIDFLNLLQVAISDGHPSPAAGDSLHPFGRLPVSTFSSTPLRISITQPQSSVGQDIMFSLARLIFIAAWIWNVQARNETLVQGWQPEPPGRGTWSILWSCLATIFICTWSALHLDVPEDHGVGYLLFRKIRWMLVAATAPEYLLWTSASNFLEARDLSKYLEARGYREWSQTQTQFASARGFETHPTQGTYSRCSLDELREHIETRRIDRPPISKKELKARGKSDWVGKLIAVLQIIWFVVQTLFRAIQHYQITALEIMTVAFVFCSILLMDSACVNHKTSSILWFWTWLRRQDIPHKRRTRPGQGEYLIDQILQKEPLCITFLLLCLVCLEEVARVFQGSTS